MEQKITLYELQAMVKDAIEPLSHNYMWVTAEISEVKRNAGSGHWYMELVDYNGSGNAVAAKARATIWSRSAAMLIPFFESTAGSPLTAGMHVLLKVQVQYSPVYGLSLNITDIDPSFTVGALELQRQQVINRLQQEGMFDINSSLELPLLPKRVAVVSSETAAGYRDFMKHISQNEYGFTIYTKLYPAPMQGNEAPDGIINVLEQIAADVESGENYDAVVIIRGGGSVIELSCFDDYNLAINIAQFPLPVLTGIGHDHDFHIADMVAHTYLKTPTAVADFLIDLYLEQSAVVESLFARAQAALSRKIAEQQTALLRLTDRLKNSTIRLIAERRNALQMLELRINAASPQQILNKGFAIVAASSGERIRSVQDVAVDDVIKIILKDGTVKVRVLE